jgi:YggT family protein
MEILCLICQLYVLAIFGRVILSWFPLSRGGVAEQVNNKLLLITEPLLGPIRRVMPRMGMLDLSPLIALLFIQIVVMRLLLSCP